MSREELREKNKRTTIEKAFALFLEQGVERTSIRDIAQAAGLTERSVYRYFASKSDIILATSYVFWERMSQRVEQLVRERSDESMTGIEQIRLMLLFYSSLYQKHPESVRYVLQAEAALSAAGVTVDIRDRPPGRFDDGNTPLVRAIQAGLADGSVSPQADVKLIYYNAYDAILGTMQRQVLGSTDCDLDQGKRMEQLCELFVKAFQGKI